MDIQHDSQQLPALPMVLNVFGTKEGANDKSCVGCPAVAGMLT